MPYVSCTLADSFGRTTHRLYEIEEQANLADYITAITSFRNALDGVTDLELVRCDLVIQAIVAGFAAAAGANVDVGATFSGYIDGGNGKKASHKIPGIGMALVNPDGSVPIVAAVDTYLTEFQTGEDFLLSDGEHISAWIRGTLDR